MPRHHLPNVSDGDQHMGAVGVVEVMWQSRKKAATPSGVLYSGVFCLFVCFIFILYEL